MKLKIVYLIRFVIDCIYKTALHIAVENRDQEIVKLLLNCENIDVNLESIFNQKY